MLPQIELKEMNKVFVALKGQQGNNSFTITNICILKDQFYARVLFLGPPFGILFYIDREECPLAVRSFNHNCRFGCASVVK